MATTTTRQRNFSGEPLQVWDAIRNGKLRCRKTRRMMCTESGLESRGLQVEDERSKHVS